MTRGTYLYDDVSGRVLPKDEVVGLRARRRAEKTRRSGLYENRTVERGHWVYDKRSGELVPKAEYRAGGLTIIKDLEPYQNMIDGKPIGGRKQHRDFLRAHGVREVGNEKVEKQYEPPSTKAELGHDIARAMQETGYWKP